MGRWTHTQVTHTHTHTHTKTHTHTHTQRAGRQTGRARNEPGQEIRFLGGFAMGTGLQSTAAWGRGRSRARGQEGRGGDGDGVIKPVQGLGWANGQSGNPTSTTALPLLPL